MTRVSRLIAIAISITFLLGGAAAAWAAVGGAPPEGFTPPRLTYTDGEVSFWRPGDDGWEPAMLNTPLAAGDELATGRQGTVELQIGPRAFVRAWGDSQVGLISQQPSYVQLRLVNGRLALDLRALDPQQVVYLETATARFTVAAPGYYRMDVNPEHVSFITRSGGRASMTAGGQQVTIGPDQDVVVEGPPPATVQMYPAPERDAWDRWNQVRSDQLVTPASASYVPAGVYGATELEQHGTWRTVTEYGPVWTPATVPVGWAPYSTGRWIRDPYYNWTWVDAAPWGWAPYHYGRWVFIDGVWAWAPGPVVVRPVYTPALVVFFGAPTVVVGGPVSWVALGWGEPIVPWWGPVGYIGRPRWSGWGGPRVVNNTIINNTTIINVNNIRYYRNTTVQNAVVAVPKEHFQGRPVQEGRIREVDVRKLEPVRGALAVAPRSMPGAPNAQGRPDRSDKAEARGRPLDQQGRPIEQQGRPDRSDVRGRPDRTDRQGRLDKSDPQGRPIEQQGRPIQQQGRPIEQQGRPIEQQGRPIEQQGRPIQQQGRPIEQQGRPIQQQGRPERIDPQGQPDRIEMPPQGRPDKFDVPQQGRPDRRGEVTSPRGRDAQARPVVTHRPERATASTRALPPAPTAGAVPEIDAHRPDVGRMRPAADGRRDQPVVRHPEAGRGKTPLEGRR